MSFLSVELTLIWAVFVFPPLLPDVSQVFSGLVKLRKLCNHPDLVTNEYSKDRQASAVEEDEEEEEMEGGDLDASKFKKRKGLVLSTYMRCHML